MEFSEAPLHINHYAIQSWNWFRDVKMTRGDVHVSQNENVRDRKYFDKYDRNDIEDNELALKHKK